MRTMCYPQRHFVFSRSKLRAFWHAGLPASTPVRWSKSFPGKTKLTIIMLTLMAGGVEADPPGRRRPSLDGYCPASYLLTGKAVKGDPAYPVDYAGEVYWLANEKAKKAFEANPEKYMPQFAGWDAMALGGPNGKRFDGNPKIFLIIDSKVYLFTLERSRKAYEENPTGILEKAARVFHTPRIGGYDCVSYIEQHKAIQGDPRLHAIYRRKVYHFSRSEFRDRFIQNPTKYLPQYHGYDATSLARERRKFYADPKHFSVIDGKTYLFMTMESKQWFDTHAETAVRRSKAVWARIKDAG